MILAIDVGGTKTLLALYRENGSDWILYKEQLYKSADFSAIEDMINGFIGGDKLGIRAVCAGVAGPVINEECKITNLSWSVTVEGIKKTTGAKQVYLLNDLAATAWAVALAKLQYEEINTNLEGTKLGSGGIAILSAGTGLGEAVLIQDLQSYKVLATEGGHGSFAPQNEQQDRLLVFLRKKYNGHVSYERLVSGTGLHNIYLFLQSEGRFPANKAMAEKIQLAEDPAEVIGSEAISGGDVLCNEALRLFCEVYAAEAGNLALKCLPQGGVVLAGGISPKILSLIKRQFMQAFVHKGRYSDYLAGLSVRVCMDEKAVLLGALAYAKTQAAI